MALNPLQLTDLARARLVTRRRPTSAPIGASPPERWRRLATVVPFASRRARSTRRAA